MKIMDNILNKDVIDASVTFLVILPSVFLIYFATFITIRNYHEKLKTFLLEYALIALPMLFNITIFVKHIYLVLTLLFIICTVMTYRQQSTLKRSKKQDVTSKHYTFITNARSAINLLTAIAILAVDFKIFPKSFSKTKKYGFSLMDVGVGLFVYANGIVAPKRKESFLKILKDSIPLFVLGIGRYLITREINYHVAVWEYGVHWNFFMTLGMTKVFGSLFIKWVGEKYLIVYAPFLLLVHEALLQLGLADYVFGPADREQSFIAANREGIISSTGYIAIYLFSVPVGNLLKNKKLSKLQMVFMLSMLSSVLFIATFSLYYYFDTSRRLANSSYCCWTLFIGIFMTEMFYLCEALHKKMTKSNFVPPPFIFEAINYNGLVFFLVCNVLTGFVNIVFNTKKVAAFNSLLILSLYLLMSCALVAILCVKRVRLKL